MQGIALGGINMAMLAFYAGLLIGVVTGMVVISLIPMIQQRGKAQEADRH